MVLAFANQYEHFCKFYKNLQICKKSYIHQNFQKSAPRVGGQACRTRSRIRGWHGGHRSDRKIKSWLWLVATCLSKGRNSCRIRNPWIFFDFSIENQELLMRHGFRPLDRHVATSHSQDLFFRQTCVHHANPLCDFLCDRLVRLPCGSFFEILKNLRFLQICKFLQKSLNFSCWFANTKTTRKAKGMCFFMRRTHLEALRTF